MTIAANQTWERNEPKDGEPSRVVIGSVYKNYVLFTNGGSCHVDTLRREMTMIKEASE